MPRKVSLGGGKPGPSAAPLRWASALIVLAINLAACQAAPIAARTGVPVPTLFVPAASRMAPSVPTISVIPEPTSAATAGPSVTAAALPTLAASVSPMPTTPYLRPRLSNFRFCDRACASIGATQLTLFPEGTWQLFASWDYSGLRPGLAYTRLWTFQGEEWIRYNCVWQGPEAGTFAIRLWDTGGLRSGDWTLTIYVEGELAATTSVTIGGHNNYWAPAGERPCPDF
jgi:hypothetical protein